MFHQSGFRPVTRRRVNVGDESDALYWSKELGVTQDELARAVAMVGDDFEDLEKMLSQRSRAA